MIAIFLPMFLMRPKSPMAFALPEDLRPAPLGRRLLAGLIDFLPFYFLAHVALLLSLPTMDKREILDFAEQVFNRQRLPLQVAVVVLGMLVGYAGYCTIFEMLFGATIGKRIMKMRVVGFDGGPASFRGCLLRNLVKIIEMIWLLPIPILFLIPLLNRNRQRLGDMLARTVVADASQRSTAQPPPPPTPPGSGEDPSGRGDPPDPPA